MVFKSSLNLVGYEFCFVDYDLLAPDASSKLRGLHESMTYASLTSVKNCRRALRQNGISMKSAFGALSIKVLAALLSKYYQNSGPPKECAHRDWKCLKAKMELMQGDWANGATTANVSPSCFLPLQITHSLRTHL